MKQNTFTLALMFTGIIGIGQICAQTPGQPAVPAPPAPPEAPKLSEKEAFTIGAYILGYQQGRGMHGAGFKEGEFNTDELMKGLVDGLKGKDSAIPEDKVAAAMQILQGLVQERAKKKAEEKLAAGKAFLEKNAKREGVKTTASGLQYEVIKKGGERKYVAPADGSPDFGTKFLIHYKGTLLDGEEFDSSAKHSPDGSPSEFTLRVVPGFAEALKMIPVGAKWKIYLPSELGYGANPNGPGGPNSVLIFELELVDIKSAPQAPPVPPGVIRPQPARPDGASATTPPVPVPAEPKPAEPKPEEKEKTEKKEKAE